MSELLEFPLETIEDDFALFSFHEMPIDELIRCLHGDVWPSLDICHDFGIFNKTHYEIAQYLIKQEIVSRDELMSIEGHPERWNYFISKARLNGVDGAFTAYNHGTKH